MRVFLVAILTCSLLATNVLAQAPLAPGKPAGVKKAQDNHQLELYLIGAAGLAAAGLGVIVAKAKTSSTAATAS